MGCCKNFSTANSIVKRLSIESYELLGFFEVEPKVDDLTMPWECTDCTYRTTIGQFEIEFGITEHYADVSLQMLRDSVVLLSISALSVHDVRLTKMREVEIIEVIVNTHHSISIQLRPTLFIKQILRETEPRPK
jgi:hypothetical protein